MQIEYYALSLQLTINVYNSGNPKGAPAQKAKNPTRSKCQVAGVSSSAQFRQVLLVLLLFTEDVADHYL